PEKDYYRQAKNPERSVQSFVVILMLDKIALLPIIFEPSHVPAYARGVTEALPSEDVRVPLKVDEAFLQLLRSIPRAVAISYIAEDNPQPALENPYMHNYWQYKTDIHKIVDQFLKERFPRLDSTLQNALDQLINRPNYSN